MALLPVAGVSSLCSLFSRNLRFLSFLSFLPCSEDSATVVRDRAGAFLLAGFAFLVLDSLRQSSLADVPLVCTFEALLLEGW